MGQSPLSPETQSRVTAWNRGYTDGYQGHGCQLGQSEPYYTGYDVGKTDRAEDEESIEAEEAVESGDYDSLTEEERLEVYGNERDQP